MIDTNNDVVAKLYVHSYIHDHPGLKKKEIIKRIGFSRRWGAKLIDSLRVAGRVYYHREKKGYFCAGRECRRTRL